MKTLLSFIAVAALAACAFGSGGPSGTATTLAPPPHSRDVELNTAVPVVVDGSLPIVFKAPPAPRAAQAGGTGSWSFNAVWDFKSRKIDAVAINDLHELTSKGRPTGFWISAFAGTTADKDGKAVAGIGISHHRQLFDQLYLQSFIGIKVEAGVPISGVLGGGISYRF